MHLAVIFIVPIIFSVVKGFILQNTSIWQFATSVAGEKATFEFYVSTLNIFFCNFPYLMHVTFEFVALMHVLFINWDLSLIPSEV